MSENEPDQASEANESRMAQLVDLIETTVQKTLGKLLNDGGLKVVETSGPRKAGDVDVEVQVNKAVAAAAEKERRSAAEKARDERIAQLEAKLEGRERTPREHRPISRMMGWVHPDDE